MITILAGSLVGLTSAFVEEGDYYQNPDPNWLFRRNAKAQLTRLTYPIFPTPGPQPQLEPVYPHWEYNAFFEEGKCILQGEKYQLVHFVYDKRTESMYGTILFREFEQDFYYAGHTQGEPHYAYTLSALMQSEKWRHHEPTRLKLFAPRDFMPLATWKLSKDGEDHYFLDADFLNLKSNHGYSADEICTALKQWWMKPAPSLTNSSVYSYWISISLSKC